MGFYAVWLLQIAFWWGVFLMRRELIGFISLDQRARDGAGLGLGSSTSADGGHSPLGMAVAGGAGYWLTRAGARAMGRVITAPARGVRHMRRDALEHRAARDEAMREHQYEGAKARGVEDAQRVVDQEAGWEGQSKARKAGMQERVRALDEKKQMYRGRLPKLEQRKRTLEGSADGLRSRDERLGQRIRQFEEGIARIDGALAHPHTPQATKDKLLEMRAKGEAKLEALSLERDQNASKLGATERGIGGVDAEIGSMRGQMGVADRGIARWKNEIADADAQLAELYDERGTARSREAHATVDRSERDFARSEFVPDAPVSGPGSAPMSRREGRNARRAAMDDGGFETLATRIDEKARTAKRDSKYRRKRDRLERERRRGFR